MKSTLLVSTLVGGLLLIEALVSAVSSELRPQVHSLRLDRGRQQNALQAQLQPSNAYYLESQSLLQSIETRPHHHLDPHPHPHPGHHHKSYDLNSDGSKDGQQQDPQSIRHPARFSSTSFESSVNSNGKVGVGWTEEEGREAIKDAIDKKALAILMQIYQAGRQLVETDKRDNDFPEKIISDLVELGKYADGQILLKTAFELAKKVGNPIVFVPTSAHTDMAFAAVAVSSDGRIIAGEAETELWHEQSLRVDESSHLYVYWELVKQAIGNQATVVVYHQYWMEEHRVSACTLEERPCIFPNQKKRCRYVVRHKENMSRFPAYISLGHEFIHVIRWLRGELISWDHSFETPSTTLTEEERCQLKKAGGFKLTGEFPYAEELTAVLGSTNVINPSDNHHINENSLRAQAGLEPRYCYLDFFMDKEIDIKSTGGKKR